MSGEEREREHKHDEGCGCDDCEQLDELTDDDLVERLDPDCAPAGLASYRGFLRRYPGGISRLYTSLDLDEYLLLGDEQILAQREYGKESVIWVRRDRTVKRVTERTPDQERLELLQGLILRRWRDAAPDTGTTTGPGGTGPLSMDVWPCPQSSPKTRCGYC